MVREALQEAIFTRLDAADYSPDMPDVYDAVPQDAEYPYIVIGDIDYRPWQQDDGTNYIAESRIYVYSEYQGRLQVNRILGVIDDELNRATDIALGTGHVVTVDFLFSSTQVEADGVVHSGRIDHRWMIGDD